MKSEDIQMKYYGIELIIELLRTLKIKMVGYLKFMKMNFRTVQYKMKDNVDSYIITNTAAADWRDIAINNANSPMVLTLDQYFKAAGDKVDAAIIAYNDLPPGAVRPNAESTAKGLVAWGADTGKAFWYVHTMHKFPDFKIADASLLLDDLIEKAALFMCLTIDYKNTAWAKALLFEKPLIYFSQKPQAVSDAQVVFLEEDITNLLNESPVTLPNNIYSKNVTTTGATPIVIHYIARYSSKTAQGEIYSRLIAPALQSSVRIWTGTSKLNSYCSGTYKIENVEGPIKIKTHELTKQYDTSVWSVTTTGEKKFCLSNVERESASFKAGGVICVVQSNIQGLFSALASDDIKQFQFVLFQRLYQVSAYSFLLILIKSVFSVSCGSWFHTQYPHCIQELHKFRLHANSLGQARSTRSSLFTQSLTQTLDVMATKSKVEASFLPKKLDLGKRRLDRLLEELNQLLDKRAAVREIEEQL
ncbi:Plancitoxin-1 [Trichinella zimbabwensis]|uniref:Plancitoxin-1 n=1 Tax=Trichinella zimbabwensis TaxID=268475 RepID=A0A0V1GV19_9BILA|nr:Plancitoxin-1 [Trichinella zimbabwensis]